MATAAKASRMRFGLRVVISRPVYISRGPVLGHVSMDEPGGEIDQWRLWRDE